MFGSNTELEKKLTCTHNMLVREIVQLDPIVRKKWLEDKKDLVDFYDYDLYKNEDEDQRRAAEIFRELIQNVQEWIDDEPYEGNNYCKFMSTSFHDLASIDQEILKKRLKQIQEDFPEPNK